MKNANNLSGFMKGILLFLFISIESGCYYYAVNSTKQPGASRAKENIETLRKQQRNIFIYTNGNYYHLSNLGYNPDSTLLTAALDTDSTYHHIYNPYHHTARRYRKELREQKVLAEAFIISEQMNVQQDTMVTIPLSSILRIDCIEKRPGGACGEFGNVMLAASMIIIPALLSVY